ncbi:hypothetical protein LCGC14_2075640 [marine sediment metagenome]|uniref:Uncharacterized protein n=1 Tax=marine sediment metagenome TaxID=412755 RepID=A0A0F9GVG0_9ZZZZ
MYKNRPDKTNSDPENPWVLFHSMHGKKEEIHIPIEQLYECVPDVVLVVCAEYRPAAGSLRHRVACREIVKRIKAQHNPTNN